MHALPIHLDRMLKVPQQSSSGFERQEREETTRFRLLCAFASRWRGDPDYEESAITPGGRAAVADTIDRLLLNLPLEKSDQLLYDILCWLAEICRNARLEESWFDDEFLEMIEVAKEFEQQQKEVKKAVEIPPREVEKIEILMKQLPEEQTREKVKVFKTLLPQSRGLEYTYNDDSNTKFYRNTYNPMAQPINILQNAQHEAVASRDPRFRDVHEKNGLEQPFHARALSAPYCYALVEANAKMNFIHALEVGQPNGRVLAQENDEERTMFKAQTLVNDAMNDCQRKIDAYEEGRMRNRSLKIEEEESMRYNGKRTYAHRDNVKYYGGKNNKKTTIFDERNDMIPKDGPAIEAYDEVLELGHDEDFTGMGLYNLSETELRAHAGVTGDEQPREGEETTKPKYAGYLFRKAVIENISEETSIPMFDKKVLPLEYKKTEGFEASISAEDVEGEILSGGPHKIDPRVYEVIETAKLVTDNKDLDLVSDSDECIDDPCFRGGIVDSDGSEEEETATLQHEMLQKTSILRDYKEALIAVQNPEIEKAQAPEFIETLQKKKNMASRKEREEFEATEAVRAKEAKKKEETFKAKKFTSSLAKEMHKTSTGAPCTIVHAVQAMKSAEQKVIEEKLRATELLEEIDAQIAQDQEREEEYLDTIEVSTRKTEAAELLKVAELMKEKDSDAPKKIISSLLFDSDFDINSCPYQVVQDAVSKLGRVNYDLQEPHVYNSNPVMHTLTERRSYEPESLTEADQPGIELYNETYLPLSSAEHPVGTSYNSVPYSQESIFDSEFGPKTQQFLRTAPNVESLSETADHNCVEPRATEPLASIEHFMKEEHEMIERTTRVEELQEDELVDQKYLKTATVFETDPNSVRPRLTEQVVGYRTNKNAPDNESFIQNVVAENELIPSLDLLRMQRAEQGNAEIEKQLGKYGIKVSGRVASAGVYRNETELESFCGLPNAIGPSTAPRSIPKKAKGKKGKKGEGKK